MKDEGPRSPPRLSESAPSDELGGLVGKLLGRASAWTPPDRPLPPLPLRAGRPPFGLRAVKWLAAGGLAAGVAWAALGRAPTTPPQAEAPPRPTAAAPPALAVAPEAPAAPAAQGEGRAARGQDCPAFTDGTSIDPCTATYLGGAGPDQAVGVGLASDGSIWLALNLSSPLPEGEEVPGAGRGAVVHVAPGGRTILTTFRVAEEVRDLEVSRGGAVAVAVDSGLVVLDAAGSVVYRRPLPGGAVRVAVSAVGTAAALDGQGQVHVFDAAGDPVGQFSSGTGTARDLAIDEATRAVFVAGYTEGPVPGACSAPVPVAYLRSFTWDGRARFRAWDLAPTDVVRRPGVRRCAHTRGTRVVVGRDGKVYFAGESYGGDTPFALDPLDPDKLAANIGYDAHTSPPGTSSRTGIGYVARLAAEDGALEVGQFLLGRAPDGAGGSLEILALAADEQGRVLVGGTQGCCMPAERGALRFAGAPVVSTRSGGFALLIESSFRARGFWTSWTDGAAATARAVALGDGFAAVVATQAARFEGKRLLTTRALAPAPLGGDDAWFALWRTP